MYVNHTSVVSFNSAKDTQAELMKISICRNKNKHKEKRCIREIYRNMRKIHILKLEKSLWSISANRKMYYMKRLYLYDIYGYVQSDHHINQILIINQSFYIFYDMGIITLSKE